MEANTSILQSTMEQTGLIFAGGEMGERIRMFDWTLTDLGAIDTWPQWLLNNVNLVLQSPVPLVLLWGSDGIMLYNNAYACLAGGKHPGLLGSKLIEGWPEVADFNRNVLEKGFNGESLSYKDQPLTLYRNNQAEEVWMDLNYSPVLDESGKPGGILAIVVETTQRVLAEQLQKQAEERFRLIMSTSSLAGIYDWHIQTDKVFADEHFSLLYSVDRDKAKQGAKLADFLAGIHPEDIREVKNAINHTINTGEPFRKEYRLLKQAGEIVWVLAQGLCSYDATGKPERLSGVVVDITEQKNSEQKLKASEERFRIMANASPHFIWELSSEGFPLYVNKAALDYVGKTYEEYIEQPWSEYLHLDDAEFVTREILEAVAARKGYRVEHRIQSATGEYQWFISSADPSFFPDGELYRYIGSAINIDDLKRAEQALATQHALAQDYARRLESSNKDLSQFASVVSHDLQAPLRKVTMFADMIKEKEAENLSEEGRKYLDRIQYSISRMTELIRDLLALSRIDRSNTPFIKTDLKDVMITVLDDLATDIAQTNAQIVLGQMVTLEADTKQITQMFSNLISNAIKYRKSDVQPIIHVQSQYIDEQSVQMTVTDNGIGIKSEYFSKIFEIFQRLHSESQYSGTGIGLAIVKRIVDRHNGIISVESIPGKSSTFKVILPKESSKFVGEVRDLQLPVD